MSDYPETQCRTCYNAGRINVGNPGETVWETCPACKGKSYTPKNWPWEVEEKERDASPDTGR